MFYPKNYFLFCKIFVSNIVAVLAVLYLCLLKYSPVPNNSPHCLFNFWIFCYPIISGNGLPLLTENNFQTPPPFYFTPLFIDIQGICCTPLFIKTLPLHYFELESISSAQILLIVQVIAIHRSIFYFSSFSVSSCTFFCKKN